MQLTVAPRGECASAGHRRSRQHRTAWHLELPTLLAGRIQAVQALVTAAEQDQVIGVSLVTHRLGDRRETGAGSHLIFRCEFPDFLSGSVETIEVPVQVADVDSALVDADGRLE